MEVRKGYKQTEVGIIPEDWDVSTLESITPRNRPNGIVDGPFGSNLKTIHYKKIGIPIITSGYVTDGQFQAYDYLYVDEEKFAQEKRSAVSPGDIVMAKIGARCGASAILPKDHEIGILSGNALKITVDNSRHSTQYIWQVLWSLYSEGDIEALRTVGAQPAISMAILKKYKIPLPPLPEQNAIAAALSDVDALLSSLDALIAKKRLIKQGVMQELLTGKKRLPGFNGEWKSKQLGELIAHCSSGATPYRGQPEYYKGNVKWITSGELNYNFITDTIEHISDDAVLKTNLKVHPVGTFLMAITGLEAAGTRGACGIVGSPSTTNQSCMAIYPTHELKTEFLYHYYVLRGNELAFKYCQGTKQQSYTAKIVKILPIDIPPTVEEQTAIAEILSDMDAEISALEQKREKTRLLKQGMMQELLTGRIRLV